MGMRGTMALGLVVLAACADGGAGGALLPANGAGSPGGDAGAADGQGSGDGGAADVAGPGNAQADAGGAAGDAGGPGGVDAPDITGLMDAGGADTGGADTGADVTGDAGGTLEGPGGWCAAWSTAWCDLLDRCPPPWTGPWSPGGCRAWVDAACAATLPAEAVQQGALAWDPSAAAACVSGLEALGCAEHAAHVVASFDLPVAACAGALVGQRAPGEPCTLGTECAPGAQCLVEAACPGTCVATVGPGDPCDAQSPCAYPDSLCLEGTCAALPAAPGDACLSGLCRAPLACDQAGGTCVTPLLQGAPCGGEGQVCYPGLVCLAPTGGTGACAALRGAGESCFESWHCSPLTDAGLLVCAGGTCEPAPSAGEPCWDYLCGDGFCDTAAIPPTCAALPGPGQPCWQGMQCAAGSFCDAGTCAPALGAGAPCETALQCESLRCSAGTCIGAQDAPCPP